MNEKRHYLIVNMPYDLLHFLIKEKCLKEYVSHALPCKLIDTIELFITYINDNPSYGIGAAFFWVDTESGWEYWNSKDSKWKEYLETQRHHYGKENNTHIS